MHIYTCIRVYEYVCIQTCDYITYICKKKIILPMVPAPTSADIRDFNSSTRARERT